MEKDTKERYDRVIRKTRGTKVLKKNLEKKHKKVVAELEKTLEKKSEIKIDPKKPKKKDKKRGKRESNFSIKQPNARSNIIGLLLFITGVTLIINSNPPNLKTSFTLILIGLFMILIIHEKNTPKDTTHTQGEEKLNSAKKNRLLMSEKITTALSIWVLLLFFITGKTDFEILFVLILIGLIVVKTLTDEFTTHRLKKRLNIFIFVFLILFITIITQKIINIVNT